MVCWTGDCAFISKHIKNNFGKSLEKSRGFLYVQGQELLWTVTCPLCLSSTREKIGYFSLPQINHRGSGVVEEKELEIIMEMKGDIEGIKSLLSTMVNTNNMAIEALQSVRSAHRRIDELKDDVKKIELGQIGFLKMITASVINTIIAGVMGFGIAQMMGG